MSSSTEKPDDGVNDTRATSVDKTPKQDPAANAREPDLRRKPRRSEPPFWLSKAKILLLVIVAGVVLTIYLYLDQRYFAPNRPIIWTTFKSEQIEKEERLGAIVVLLAGEFQSKQESTTLVEQIDVPEVRQEAHRLKTVFSTVQLEPVTESRAPNRSWLQKRLAVEAGGLPERPFFVVLYSRWEQPEVIESTGNPALRIQERLRSTRVAK